MELIAILWNVVDGLRLLDKISNLQARPICLSKNQVNFKLLAFGPEYLVI